MKTSIIIVTYNALDFFERCLLSITRNTPEDTEIIIIDNASSDRAKLEKILEMWGKREKKVAFNRKNLLWGPAVTQGMKMISKSSSFVVLLNPDTEILRTGWLKSLYSPLIINQNIAISGPQYNFSHIGPDYGGIDGHCLMFRSSLMGEIGYLSEKYPWTAAAQYYICKAWSHGYVYWQTADGFVKHFGKRSRIESGFPFKNPRIDKMQLRRDAGLVPNFSLAMYTRNRFFRVNCNKRIRRILDNE
jgi:glycosyltransferase involved in cell wall biosynthesis